MHTFARKDLISHLCTLYLFLLQLDELDRELEFRYKVEEHLSGLPRPKIARMDYLEVGHHTANESRVQMMLERREFLVNEIKSLKSDIALRPNPSKVC